MSEFSEKYGRYAVVTGASAGIGEEFARQLAERGVDLVMVARRGAKLDTLAAELEEEHGTRTEVIELDLLEPTAVAELVERTASLDVGLLVANAGITTAGPLIGNSIEAEMAVARLNMLVPLQLVHSYGNALSKRGGGGMILVSSTIAHASAPYLANYAATKAYVASLGQAVNRELRGDGVDVLTVLPGPTKTEGTETAEGIDFSKMPVPMGEPAKVVRKALRSLGRRSTVIPGALNRSMDLSGKYLTPRPVSTRMFGSLVSRALDNSPG